MDSDAIYTMVPRSVAEKLKLPVTGRRRFRLASGEAVDYAVAEAYIEATTLSF